jgi:putative glutamine amidotransferase
VSAGTVVVSSGSDEKVRPYLAALGAAGLSGEAARVVVPRRESAVPTAAGAGGAAADAVAAMDGAVGLVLSGGSDLAPEIYGETPIAGAGLALMPERDALEGQLLAVARERRLPVWGVCRGFQLLNVFFGGSLWQDLPLQRPSGVAHEVPLPLDLLGHTVHVTAPETPLGRRLGGAGARLLVNSRHHQGVKRLGAGLLAVAAAPDGLTEAVMLAPGDGDWWVRGVEWHPENLLDLADHLELWRDFVAALPAPAAVPAALSAAGGL